MEHETDTVIEVQATEIYSPSEEEIPEWYSASQVQNALNLNKTALQKAVAKLQSIYGIDLAALRRGSARATEYSQFALEAIELLNTKKLSELRKLVNTIKPASTAAVPSGTLTITEYTPTLDQRISQLGQNAASTSASLNQNVMQLLAQIATENEAAQQRDSDLKQARINAAQNRGAAQALEIYQAEQKALNEVLAQLRARQLGGAE
jgi:hypothetical protein